MSAAADQVVAFREVVKTYDDDGLKVTAVKGVSFTIRRRRFAMIVGPSGSGKTTLLNLIGCIDAPTSGQIAICGQDVARLSDNAITDFRSRNIGFIFQNFNLYPVLSAYENVEYPLLLLGMPARERRERTLAILDAVTVPVIQGIDLLIRPGRFTALLGPSGSGKTTLLNMIGCIDKPDAGRVVLDGVDVTPLPLHRLAPTRRDVLGFVFQTFNLIPVLTAYENIEYPLLLHGIGRRERRERVRRWLDEVGLTPQARQRPDQLSGGQRQRVAIARAMAGDPKLVLADEPTANLDSDTAAKILDLLQRINAETRCTFVFATHDPALIARAPRCIRMRDGALVREAAAA